MDDNSDQENGILSALQDRGRRDIPGDGAGGNDGGTTLDRRSYLVAAGLTTAALAGCTGRDASETVPPVSAFGYGGGPVLQQTDSLSIAESEPNDRRTDATPVGLGSTVAATLTVSDSDWYTVDLTAGDEVVAEFTRQAPTGITAVILYDPDGQFSNLRYVSTDQPVVVAQTAGTTGTYYIQVVDTQESDGEYTLTVGDGTASETTTETVTETETETATETATPVEDDFGEQGYGEYGYGGIST